MFNRKELKRKGKSAFYRNWKSCIIVCFVFTIIVGGTVISVDKRVNLDYREELKTININNIHGETNSDVVNEFLKEINNKSAKDNTLVKNTKGFIGTIANNVSKSGSFLFGVLNAINQALFKDRLWPSIIIVVGAFLSLLFWIFVSKVLEVGRARFFLENRKYTKTKANKLALPYKLNKTFNIALTMFVKNILNLLWCFTIVGGIIKYYSYYLVPFILAENPNMKTKDVIKLSRNLMHGYKWQFFKLDLSFILWQLLGLITFNISNLVFTTPYINCVKAEAYMQIRSFGKQNNIKNSDLLKDRYLEGEVELDEYPSYEYMFRSYKERKWLRLNYKRNYSILNLILIFFIISFGGWIWEVGLHLFQTGQLVNRGTLYGPWLPIYGAGACIILVLLKPFRKDFFLYFALTMFVCGIIEYGTSVYLELVHHMQWWNYNGFFLNLNGRICLEGLLVFGIGGVCATYVIAPVLGNLLDKLKKETKLILCIILILIIGCDFLASSKRPNQGKGVSLEIKTSIKN